MQVWKLMGSDEECLLDVTAGEYEFDVYRVILHAQHGAERGVRIRYGQNLKDLTMDQIQGVPYNAVYPFCTGEDGTLYELPEKYVAYSGLSEQAELTLHPIDLGKMEELMESYGERYEDIYEVMRALSGLALLLVCDFGDGFETAPELNLTVDFVRLSETTEYKGRPMPDEIAPGDTVHVDDPELGISVSARVCEMRYQPSMDRIKSITLGSVKRSLARTIATRTTSVKKEIEIDPDAVAAAGVSLP